MFCVSCGSTHHTAMVCKLRQRVRWHLEHNARQYWEHKARWGSEYVNPEGLELSKWYAGGLATLNASYKRKAS